jgi:hypothetical protein
VRFGCGVVKVSKPTSHCGISIFGVVAKDTEAYGSCFRSTRKCARFAPPSSAFQINKQHPLGKQLKAIDARELIFRFLKYIMIYGPSCVGLSTTFHLCNIPQSDSIPTYTTTTLVDATLSGPYFVDALLSESLRDEQEDVPKEESG